MFLQELHARSLSSWKRLTISFSSFFIASKKNKRSGMLTPKETLLIIGNVNTNSVMEAPKEVNKKQSGASISEFNVFYISYKRSGYRGVLKDRRVPNNIKERKKDCNTELVSPKSENILDNI